MNNVIDSFTMENFFLSNFYHAPVEYEGLQFTSNEAAFQSAKSLTLAVRQGFQDILPGEAKKLGRGVSLRLDWEKVKDDIMFVIVLDKFTRNITLRNKLLDTGYALLIEGNCWGDTYWGQVDGVGKNQLGRILMDVRGVLRGICD